MTGLTKNNSRNSHACHKMGNDWPMHADDVTAPAWRQRPDFPGLLSTGSELTLIPGDPDCPVVPPSERGLLGVGTVEPSLGCHASQWVPKPFLVMSQRMTGIDTLSSGRSPHTGSPTRAARPAIMGKASGSL